MESTARVVIVNYNAGEALVASVGAALASPLAARVCVADNASGDASMSRLAKTFGDEARLELTHNDTNLGFARAANALARGAMEKYVLVLNPDCVLQNGALESMIAAMDNDARAAMAGPWVTDADGRVQKGTWRRLPDPRRSLMTLTGLYRLSGRIPALTGIEAHSGQPPADVTEAEAVSGACMLLRRSAADHVGYFDEQYAMHGEDLDLMYRLRSEGWRCLLVPSARAVHLGGVSSASRPWWVHRQKHLGMHRFYRKLQAPEHAPPFRWLVYAGIWAHYLVTLPLVPFTRRAKVSPKGP